MLKSAQVWSGLIVCENVEGALTAPSVGPVGALYVNGVINGAVVTFSGSNPYKWTVPLPILSPGDIVSLYVTATVDGIATAGIVAEEVADTVRLSDIAAAVWGYLASAATTVGSLGALAVAKLGLITSGIVTVSSPVASGLNVTTIQGDDYDSADGRALTWTVSTTATLTGGTVAVILSGVDTYVGAIASETSITLELTAVQTAAMPAGAREYQIVATQSAGNGSDVITLVEGLWTSSKRVST